MSPWPSVSAEGGSSAAALYWRFDLLQGKSFRFGEAHSLQHLDHTRRVNAQSGRDVVNRFAGASSDPDLYRVRGCEASGSWSRSKLARLHRGIPSRKRQFAGHGRRAIFGLEQPSAGQPELPRLGPKGPYVSTVRAFVRSACRTYRTRIGRVKGFELRPFYPTRSPIDIASPFGLCQRTTFGPGGSIEAGSGAVGRTIGQRICPARRLGAGS